MREYELETYNPCWIKSADEECNNNVKWIKQQNKFQYLELHDKEIGITMQIIEAPLGNNKFEDDEVNGGEKMRNDMMVQFWYLKDRAPFRLCKLKTIVTLFTTKMNP